MKFNPDPLSDWEGRLFCQNDSGQSINRILRTPATVADEVNEGKEEASTEQCPHRFSLYVYAGALCNSLLSFYFITYIPWC